MLTDQFVKKKIHMAGVGLSCVINLLKIFLIKIFLGIIKNNNKIIVISKVIHLGDIVACEPVAEQYRIKYPEAFIIWCVEKKYRELIDSNPVIDYTLAVKCTTEWLLFVKLNIFDSVVDLHIENRFCHLCGIFLKKKDGSNGVDFDNYYHSGSLINVFCKAANIDVPMIAPKVYINRKVYDGLEKYDLSDPYVVIHCLSNESCRDWTIKKWRELLRRFNARKPDIKIVEVGLSPLLNDGSLRHYLDLCGELSILETAALIKRGSVFIGVDSGPAHLANAVDSRSVILLGKYRSFKRYMPYAGFFDKSDLVRILRSDGPAADLSVDAVLGELINILDA